MLNEILDGSDSERQPNADKISSVLWTEMGNCALPVPRLNHERIKCGTAQPMYVCMYCANPAQPSSNI